MPPLLTVVIFLWIAGTVQDYFFRPVKAGAQTIIIWSIADVRTERQLSADQQHAVRPMIDGVVYQRLPDKQYVPATVYDAVKESPGEASLETAQGVYRRYVELRYLRPHLAIPGILALFLLVLYLLGNVVAARVGRGLLGMLEGTIRRVPLVRNVYSAVKQVSDFLLSQRDLEYSRVVAVEYPRKGMWSLGLVTGEGLPDVEASAGEPVLSVLIPTSPMPMTGFTTNVLKSETIDLNMSIDQAIQYLVSCGVVLPSRRMRELMPPDAEPAALLAPENAKHAGDPLESQP